MSQVFFTQCLSVHIQLVFKVGRVLPRGIKIKKDHIAPYPSPILPPHPTIRPLAFFLLRPKPYCAAGAGHHRPRRAPDPGHPRAGPLARRAVGASPPCHPCAAAAGAGAATAGPPARRRGSRGPATSPSPTSAASTARRSHRPPRPSSQVVPQCSLLDNTLVKLHV